MVQKKQTLRPAAAFLLFIGLFTAVALIFSVKASAADTVIEWDGKSELMEDCTYIITDTVKLKKTIDIPVGTKLSVKKGGSLKVYSSGKINVYGELAVAQGGELHNSGTISVKKNADFSVYGLVQSSVNGALNIAGDLTVYNKGKLETSSAVKMYKTANILNKGELSFYKSSDSILSGKIVTNAGSYLQLRGKMQITLSGSITVNGHLTVGAKSAVKCSGTITLTETSSYTRFRIISVTKAGKFIDNRPEYEYQDMTVDILIDEPNIKRKGIDVSYAQGDIDWKKVADSGVEFAIIRAGRGRAGKDNKMKEDDYFRQNIKGAQENGIDVGVYFYSYATSVAEAKEEARFYVEILKDCKIQYPVCLDMEEEFQGKIGKKKLTQMIEAFFEILMENNYFPMFYSYKGWIEAYLDMTVLDKYSVWLAQVSDKVTYDGGYYIWQYSFTGKVDGIKGDVDLDYSYRDFPTILKKYGLNNL